MASKEGEKSLREQQVDERRKRMAEINPSVVRVRVTPASDELRRALKHPKSGRFPDSGSIEWPLDQFTRRRIKDGSVTREESRDDRSGGRRSPQTPPSREPAA